MYCYILYSKKIDSFYIGITQDALVERVLKHNQATYGNHYTSQANDWAIFHAIECKSISQMVLIEKHIKKMKSRTYLYNLKKFPDIQLKLLDKYASI